MRLGDIARKRLQFFSFMAAMSVIFAAPQAVMAQAQPAPEAPVAEAVDTGDGAPAEAVAPADAAAVPAAEAGAETAGGYEPLGPEWIVGQPTSGALSFQDQHSENGHFALWMHDAILLPVIIAICLFVLGLLLWVVARFNRRANAVPSKTSHNTLIEIIWTAVPVLILVIIAVPSITLLARQYKSPPEDAVTIKVTGYQWYWGYTYPDNGGFEVISNMMPEEEARAAGFPAQLEVDNRMVVPVGEPIRIQTTGADVIHSFAVPSLWFKIDAVPGRINEREMIIDRPGIYYGQCSELCGARHGYMPIAIEAVPRPQFEAWLLSQPGGTLGEEEEAAPAATPATATQLPASAEEDAPGAGPPPTGDTAPGVPVPDEV